MRKLLPMLSGVFLLYHSSVYADVDMFKQFDKVSQDRARAEALAQQREEYEFSRNRGCSGQGCHNRAHMEFQRQRYNGAASDETNEPGLLRDHR